MHTKQPSLPKPKILENDPDPTAGFTDSIISKNMSIVEIPTELTEKVNVLKPVYVKEKMM